MKHAACVVALATVALAPCALRANPMDMYGLGSRSAAMGGAVTADVEDFSANYYNPAGLARGRASRLELGYFFASHTLISNGRDNRVDPAHGIVTGLVLPGRVFGLAFAFGVTLHVPDDRLARSRLLSQQQPRWELYDNRVQRLYFAPNVAIAPWPWLRLGGGFSYIASTRGDIGVTGEIAIPNSRDSQLFHTVNADVLAVFYPQFGVQVDALPNLSFGATYRGQFSFRLDLDAAVNVQGVAGAPSDPAATRFPASLTLNERATTAFLPQQVAVGASFRPVPSLTLVADLTWVNWSAYVNPSPDVAVAIEFAVPPGLNIPIPSAPPRETVLPPRFSDTLVPRVGAEWRRSLGAHEIALRAGYRYDASPAPAQVGLTNFMDATRHGVSAGAAFTLRQPRSVLLGDLTLSVHADVQILERRVMTKDDPADRIGDYVLGGHVLNLGATLATTF